MSLVNKLLYGGFAFWFALSQILMGMSAAYAQSDLTDFEPPLIEHNVVGAVEAASRQSFFATVVDDAELDSVTLYFRFENESTYDTVEMERVSASSTYSAYVQTDPNSDRNIEYYIQARDKAGNRTVRGYAFNPLLRDINSAASADPVPTQPAPTMFESLGKRKTVLYVVLGALAVGAIAVAVNAEGSEAGPACPNDLCTVSITVVQP